MPHSHHHSHPQAEPESGPTFRQELRVLAVLACFIVLLELIARWLAPYLDFDRKHIHQFSNIIEKLEAEPHAASASARVVYFGNSLILHGVDEDQIHAELARAGQDPITSAKITPVGSGALDWTYLYRRYFSATGSHPDLFIVGFVAHHIHDQEPPDLRRMARHFVSVGDLPDLWRCEHLGFHDITQSTLCNLSALAGDQPELMYRTLNRWLPDYRLGLNRNHDLVTAAAKSGSAADPSRPNGAAESFQRLERFLSECRAGGTKVWLVPMPQPKSWPLNPAVAGIAERHGALLLDARMLDGMTADDFYDGYHLGETGRKKFSHWLAGKLRESPLARNEARPSVR